MGVCPDHALQSRNWSVAVAKAVESVRFILEHCGAHDVRLLYAMVLIAEVHIQRRRLAAALE